MSFLAVVFIVLMILWLLSGGYSAYNPERGPWLYANTIIPWVCVAILGYILLTGGDSTASHVR